MQLSNKPKTFLCLFIALLRSALNFEILKKKIEPHSLSFSEIINSERRGYRNT